MLKAEQDELLQQIKAGSSTALKSLFNAYYPLVCSGIFRLVKDKDLAQDLAQKVFIRFWEKRESLQISSSVKSYLYKMGVNEGLAYLRSAKIMEEEDQIPDYTDRSSTEEEVLGNELSEQIEKAVATLPTKCQLVFKLSRFEHLSYKEIAAKLNISVKTVENQMGKALKLLREQLQEYL
ncbi:MAG: RNA polymerase sigma-70 factor [Bacteroidota bacterium]